MTTEPADAKVGRGWRVAALSLSGILVANWVLAAYFAYSFVDTGMSLSYCRSEQDRLNHDIRVLVAAGRGRLSLDTLVAARDEVDPKLRGKTDGSRTLQLESVTLVFGQDGLLTGVSRADK